MKRILIVIGAAGLVWLCASGDACASSKAKPSALSPAGISKTFQGIGTGTKKLVQGTVDVLTLKSLREKKKPSASQSSKPWLNNTRKKKVEEKKSFWSSLLPSKEKPKRVETMRDFVGLERPR